MGSPIEKTTKITNAGVFYVPVEIRNALGLKIKVIFGTCAAIIFSENASYEDVLKSLELIQHSIEHLKKLQGGGAR